MTAALSTARASAARWPILTGERGHYELAAGHDPKPFIAAMEKFANEGGMISEQLWDAEDLPEKGMKRGRPTGAAMPLCWSHAEYVSLVRSAHDGVCFDRVEPAFQRYVVNPVKNPARNVERPSSDSPHAAGTNLAPHRCGRRNRRLVRQ